MNNLPELLLRSQAPHVAANSLQLRTPQSRTKAIQLSSPALVAYCNVYGILLMVSSASACYVQCIPMIKFYALPKKGLLQLVFKYHGFTACNTQVACVCKKTGEKLLQINLKCATLGEVLLPRSDRKLHLHQLISKYLPNPSKSLWRGRDGFNQCRPGTILVLISHVEDLPHCMDDLNVC